MRIFVTDTHTRMALALIRELGQEFPNADIFSVMDTIKREGRAGLHSRYIAGTADAGDLALFESESAGPDDILVPVMGEAVHSDIKNIKGLWPTADALQLASDKPKMAQVARDLGMLVPEEYPADAPRFPCVVKYRNSEAVRLPAASRYAIARNFGEYKEAKARLCRASNSEIFDSEYFASDVFASEYVEGPAYGVSAVLDENSDPLAVFSHKRVREYPVSGGPASCAESIWDPELIRSALTLLKALKLRGFAMVEFKGYLSEKPYLIEVNPRVWGTYPLSRLCGAGMAKAYVNGALGLAAPISLTEECPYTLGLRMQFLANDLCHFAARPDFGVIRDMLSPAVKGGVLDRSDWAGNFSYIRQNLRNLVKGR